jgi:hypothetical protein
LVELGPATVRAASRHARVDQKGKTLKLEGIKNGASLEGVEPSTVVTVVAAIAIPPDSLQLVYRLPDGALRERLLSRADEASLAVATASRPWSFDGDGAAFQLTAEAKRIDLAYLFDPRMAVHTSNVEPLPHQITAVHESMLPRQPLRTATPFISFTKRSRTSSAIKRPS